MPNFEHLKVDNETELEDGVSPSPPPCHCHCKYVSDNQSSPLLSKETFPVLAPDSPSQKEGILRNNSDDEQHDLSVCPVLRSRLCTNMHRPKDVKHGDRTTGEWSTVLHSPSSEEDFTRLKMACRVTWTKFLVQLTERNAKANGPLTSKDSLKGLVSSESHVKEEGTLGGNSPPALPNCTVANKLTPMVPSALLVLLKIIFFGFALSFILYCLMVFHKPTQAFVSRHTQDWIYPLMRTVRFASLPFIQRYPRFHELYEDACLLSNPFFEMNDVSCWPCENVRHVVDLTGFSNFTNGYYHSGIPFVVKDGFRNPVRIEDLYRLYQREEKLAGSVLVQSSHSEVTTFDDLMRYNIRNGRFFSGNLHIAWKINRAQYARLMRQHFSRPYYIPNSTEVSVQHFLFVDEPLAEQYALPVTEFANVFVMQAEGHRLIILVPVKHCRSLCKVISIALQPNDVLFYNWLFWRPISLPMTTVQSSELSVTYVGSFY